MTKPQLTLSWKLGPAVLIGILFFVISYLLTDPNDRPKLTHDAIKDLGIIIFGIAAVEVVWKAAGGAPIDITLDEIKTLSKDMREKTDANLANLSSASNSILNTSSRVEGLVEKMSVIVEAANRTGITNIGANQDELGCTPAEIIKRANEATKKIEMCGTTLYVIYSNDAALNAILDAAARGVGVRILLPCPSADPKILVAIFKDRFLADIKLGSLIKEIARKIKYRHSAPAAFEVKMLAEKTLTMTCIRFDEFMLVTPYLYEKQTSESPRLQIEGSATPLFKTYLSEFDSLFSIADPVTVPEPQPEASA